MEIPLCVKMMPLHGASGGPVLSFQHLQKQLEAVEKKGGGENLLCVVHGVPTHSELCLVRPLMKTKRFRESLRCTDMIVFHLNLTTVFNGQRRDLDTWLADSPRGARSAGRGEVLFSTQPLLSKWNKFAN